MLWKKNEGAKTQVVGVNLSYQIQNIFPPIEKQLV